MYIVSNYPTEEPYSIVLPQMLSGDDTAWHLMSVNDSKTQSWAPEFCVKHLQSAGFYLLIMTAIITDAILAASLVFTPDGSNRDDVYSTYYYAEVYGTH